MLNKLFECPLCQGLSTTEEWNLVTVRDYTNREKRRKHIPLEKNVREHLKKDIIYKCPSCLRFSSRESIKESHITDDEIVKV